MTSGHVVRPVLTLETERLLLRPFRDTDIEPYAAMCADPDVMRYVGDRGVRSLMPSSLFDGSERSTCRSSRSMAAQRSVRPCVQERLRWGPCRSPGGQQRAGERGRAEERRDA